MTQRVTISIPSTPPSNNAWPGINRFKAHRVKKEWEREIGFSLLAAGFDTRCSFIEARVVLIFPTRRRRDVDNYRAVISKFLADALQPRWLDDDTADYFRLADCAIRPGKGDAETIVMLDYTPAEAAA